MSKFLSLNNNTINNNVTFFLTNNTPSSSSLSFGEKNKRDIHEASSYTPTCCYNSLKLNPPFDSAMALTVLVLLTALFFMGFFSIYIRRFADENSVDPTRRRRRTASSAAAARNGGKGVGAAVVESLPVYIYNGGDVEQGIVDSVKVEERECAICLSEFEGREWVKEIPYCGHVFHAECIDTWLFTHVTCPLCRTAELFPTAVEKGHVAGGKEGESGVSEAQADVQNRDTWRETVREVGPERGRRSNSISCWFGERVTLHRSLSF